MALPLYRDCLPARQQDSHAGLWFDRFFDRYDDTWQVPKDDTGKLAWINTVAGKVGGNAVAAYANRQQALAASLGGRSIVAKTDWHFATGLGNGHPVENGFAWHPTLGVPYLSGAAVKGLLRAWCEVWLQWNEKQDSRLLQWFGDTARAGDLIFFDALPTDPVMLKADVMTPHMGDWYEKGGEAPKADGSNIPADWHDPVPVPFLVVDKNQPFQFSLACRPTGSAKSIDLDEVTRELENALAYLGAGAKTAAGYGRMSPPRHHALKTAETQTEWLEAEASFDKGRQTLVVLLGAGKRIDCSRENSRRFMENCQPENMARMDKKKSVKVNVQLATEGNKQTVCQLEWRPPC